MKRIVLLGAVLLTLIACKSTPEGGDIAPVTDGTGTKITAPANPGGSTGSSAGSSVSSTPIAPAVAATTNTGGRGDPKLREGALATRSIYFDYDGFLVSPEYKAVVEAHAKYLMANKSARMRIEGNTDERGSREYNLALGQRRADAVKRALVLLGASEVQIETVSFGEEKPRLPGSTEEAWRENRRSDIAYAGE
jgi:peptidoglycan-associated lipoprotein